MVTNIANIIYLIHQILKRIELYENKTKETHFFLAVMICLEDLSQLSEIESLIYEMEFIFMLLTNAFDLLHESFLVLF